MVGPLAWLVRLLHRGAMARLSIIYTSTREQRAGTPIFTWFVEAAKAHGGFEVAEVDLQAIDLPLMNEPHHPRLQKYVHQKTKDWSALVAASDAFVFVVPEYNFALPPALLNALDFLFVEWNYKACAVVSYGGASGGLRATQSVRQMVPNLKMMPITESVAVPFFTKQIDNGVFTPNEPQAKSVAPLLDELAKWTTALKTLRA